MKALRTILAILVVTALVASPLAALGDIIQRPVSLPEGGAQGAEDGDAFYSPPILPENPNPPDPGGGDLITMSLVWLGLL